MHILRIIGEIGYNLGTGPAKQAQLLTQGLARQGVYSTVLTYKTQGENFHPLIQSKSYKPLFNNRSFSISLSMIKDSLGSRADLIHVHGYRNFQTDLGALTSLLKDRPLVITAHGSVLAFALGGWSVGSRRLQELYDRVSRTFALNQADVVVATCRKEASELTEFGVPTSKIRVVPNSVELSTLDSTPPLGLKEGKVRLLIVTRITFIRNLELALRAFAQALEMDKDLVLDIVGGEKPSSNTAIEDFHYKERLQKLCFSLGIAENVDFSGWLFGRQLLDKYRCSDIFLWTSRYDSFGTELIEAANFGLPIISTDVGIARDVIDNGSGGFLVPDNPVTIAQAILTLARDNELRVRMGLHNLLKAREYSPEQMTVRYLRIYQELLHNHFTTTRDYGPSSERAGSPIKA